MCCLCTGTTFSHELESFASIWYAYWIIALYHEFNFNDFSTRVKMHEGEYIPMFTTFSQPFLPTVVLFLHICVL